MMTEDERQVFIHVGLPKTGTTFLQRSLAQAREPLRRRGLLYPGTRNDHFLPALDVLGWDFQGFEDPRRVGSWNSLLYEISRWGGSALISHEILSAATPDQIDRIVDDVGWAETHVVLTVRDPARQLLAVWQEDVKNRSTRTFEQYFRRVKRQGPGKRDSSSTYWKYQDLPRILEDWSRHIPRERVHVVTVPPRGTSGEVLWQRFLQTLGLDATGLEIARDRSNVSLGAAETEVLRRVNERLAPDISWRTYERVVKFHLANDVLGRRVDSAPLRLRKADYSWCVKEAARLKEAIERHAYPVTGDLRDLMPGPWDDTPRDNDSRLLDDQLDAALDAVGALIRAIDDTSEPPTAPPADQGVQGVVGRIRASLAQDRRGT